MGLKANGVDIPPRSKVVTDAYRAGWEETFGDLPDDKLELLDRQEIAELDITDEIIERAEPLN
jgi:hypothetical protein